MIQIMLAGSTISQLISQMLGELGIELYYLRIIV